MQRMVFEDIWMQNLIYFTSYHLTKDIKDQKYVLTKQRGELLLTIYNNLLTIDNQGNEPTFIWLTSSNVLDMTLYTNNEECVLGCA